MRPTSEWVVYGSAVVAALLIFRLPLALAAGLVVGAALLIATLLYPLFGLGVALLLGPFGALEAIILGPTLLDSGQITLLLTFAA